MNNFNIYSYTNKDREIDIILNKESKSFNDKYMDFMLLVVRLMNDLIEYEEFKSLYNNLYFGLKKEQIKKFEKITRLYLENILEVYKYNFDNISSKKLTLRKKGNDIYE